MRIATPIPDVELRVLGSLIEKELTTPDSYPLTLNALTASCNQTTNREPVMRLEESAVAAAADALGRRGLVRASTPMGSRVRKYEHVLTNLLHLDRRERAVLGVLLLRGAQTPGELHARTARLADFLDSDQVEGLLEALAARDEPLVARLERRPGQKEVRWSHLLGGPPAEQAFAEDAPAAPAAAAEDGGRVAALERRVEELAAEVAGLRAQVEEMRKVFE